MYIYTLYICGPGSSVGIATELRAGGSAIESRWGRDFPPFHTGSGAHPTYCKMGTGSFPGVKCSRGVLLTTQTVLVPRSWKSRAIPLPTLWDHTAPVTGSLYLKCFQLIFFFKKFILTFRWTSWQQDCNTMLRVTQIRIWHVCGRLLFFYKFINSSKHFSPYMETKT